MKLLPVVALFATLAAPAQAVTFTMSRYQEAAQYTTFADDTGIVSFFPRATNLLPSSVAWMHTQEFAHSTENGLEGFVFNLHGPFWAQYRFTELMPDGYLNEWGFRQIDITNRFLAAASSGDFVFSTVDGYDYRVEVQGTVTPIPEPETYALMLAGLGALAAFGRRRLC